MIDAESEYPYDDDDNTATGGDHKDNNDVNVDHHDDNNDGDDSHHLGSTDNQSKVTVSCD